VIGIYSSNFFNLFPFFYARAREVFFSTRPSFSDRIAEWGIFYSITDKFEENFLLSDLRHLSMKNRRQFYNIKDNLIISGAFKHASEYDTRQIEYGKKALGRVREQTILDRKASLNYRTTIENGAALLFSRTDYFEVRVFVFLPKTDNSFPTDEAYLIDNLEAGINLTSLQSINRSAKYFRAIAEIYSVDGEPNLTDALRAAYAKYFFPYLRNGKLQPNRAQEFFGKVFQLTVTVVFSAILVSLIQKYLDSGAN